MLVRLRILPRALLAEEAQRLGEDFPAGPSSTVPRQLTIKQEAAFGSRPNGLGSRAQDKNTQLERQAPN